MSSSHALRITAAAAATALAAFGAHAIEAVQWEQQQTDTTLSASNDATLSPNAWTVGGGEATVFHDATSKDTMTARAEVRDALRESRSRHLLDDTGEAGATERVLAQRETYIAAERERLMAMNSPADATLDPIAQLAVQSALVDARDGTPSEEVAVEDASLRMPVQPSPDELAMTMGPDAQWRDEHIIAEGPSYIDTTAGATSEPVTVASLR